MGLTHILLVDDDKDDQFFFMEALKELGLQVTCNIADDGVKGLNLLKNISNPDLIFLDLNMPQMNGFDFLETIKKDEKLKSIPVVIFSTSKHYKDIKKANELKAIAYLTKPNNLNSLSEKLSKTFLLDFNVVKDIVVIE